MGLCELGRTAAVSFLSIVNCIFTNSLLFCSVRLKNEASGVLAKDALRQIEEKDAQIKELMEEGEKLSKQQFQSSNHIKKLRSKQTELEAEITKLR